MRIRLLNLWDHFRASFWFLPTIVISITILTAFILPQVDHWSHSWIVTYLPWLTTSRDVALLLLSNIASSMITVAGIVFSLTVLILSNASSSYGSRIMRTYMQDPVTQFAIGAFVAPSLYCFLVLRHLGHSHGEVPHLSVSIGILFTILNFGVLIYFVHHVALAIQAPQVIQSLSRELSFSIESLFPENLGQDSETDDVDPKRIGSFNEEGVTQIRASKEGYLQIVDLERLVEIARQREIAILVERRPGDFITRDQYVFRLTGLKDEVELKLIRELNETLFIGSRRTPRQDVECAVQEMVEVAVRALSPGINDPFTAITCLDYLTAAMAKLSQRQIPSSYRYDSDQKLRVIASPFTFTGVLDSGLNQIRQCSSGIASVLIRMLERLTMLATFVTRKQDRDGVRKHAEMVLREAQQSLHEPEDLETIKNRYDDFLKALSGIRSVESEITYDEY
ncbi:MAG: DUF2254 domain-containing protein [Planctomycetaceae bacterium]|nr:DUF2254 domain-containing protein [Planctomycetaceae bacterium]